MLLGTFVRIKLYGENEDDLRKAADAGFKELLRIDSLFNTFNPISPLSLLNKNKKIKNKDIENVVRKAIEISELTGGAFDITVYPLLLLWGFYDSVPPNRTPLKEEIKKVLDSVSYKKIKILKDTVFLYGCSIDLGGIGKGYAVDRAVEQILSFKNVKKGIIDAGGDIRCFGRRKEHWKIGIKNPRGNGIIMVKEIGNVAIATSGDYENFYVINNRRYHHLINPKTGFPSYKCVSATVVAPDAVTADALSTALFVMGKEGIKMLDSLNDKIEGMIIYKNGESLSFSKTKNWK